MKIAVLISGYLRTFNKTYQNLLDFINLNSDHTFNFYFLIINDESNDLSILDKFNKKLCIIKSELEVSTQFLNLKILYDDFIKYNDEHKLKYDLLIRTRYDNFIEEYKLKDITFYEDNIIVPKYFFYGMTNDLKSNLSINNRFWSKNNLKAIKMYDENYLINDRFAIGTPQNMHFYFTLNDSFNNILSKFKNINGFSSTEGILSYHLKTNSIKYKHDDELFTQLIR